MSLQNISSAKGVAPVRKDAKKEGEKNFNLMQEREMNGVRTTRDGGDVRKPAGLGEEEGRGRGKLVPSGTARRGTICHLSPHFAEVPRLRFQRRAGLPTASVEKHVACAGSSSSSSAFTLRRGEGGEGGEGGKDYH